MKFGMADRFWGVRVVDVRIFKGLFPWDCGLKGKI